MEPRALSTTTATGSSSLLTAQAEPHWPPTALSRPFCLHAQSSEQQGCWQAEVKWCACWPAICVCGGAGWQLTGRMERESSPVCHISPPHLIPATVSLNNNLLPKWKAKCTPAPNEGDLCLLRNKRWLDTWEGSNANESHSMKWVQFSIVLSALVICARVK